VRATALSGRGEHAAPGACPHSSTLARDGGSALSGGLAAGRQAWMQTQPVQTHRGRRCLSIPLRGLPARCKTKHAMAARAWVGVSLTVSMLSTKHALCTAMSRRRNGQGPQRSTTTHDLRRTRTRERCPAVSRVLLRRSAGCCFVPLPDGAARAPYAMPRCDTGYLSTPTIWSPSRAIAVCCVVDSDYFSPLLLRAQLAAQCAA
jgi:hypothetical protein